MMSIGDWKVPAGVQPKADRYGFDLDLALSSVVGLTSSVPGDAFSAESLGTERAGNGVIIRDTGLVATIGYLITEAESVWLNLSDGRIIPAHVVGIDGESGIGLVQALARISLAALPVGSAAGLGPGDKVVVAGAGGRHRSVAAEITARHEFAGYWEYLLEDAIFTTPSHPHWGGTAVIDEAGRLVGIGSLQLQQERSSGRSDQMNMAVPIDALAPVIDDLLAFGRPSRPPRPWLGIYATEMGDKIVVAGVASGGPAEQAGLEIGDAIVSVGGNRPADLAGLFRHVWSLGQAGTPVPLRIARADRTLDVTLASIDRATLLRKPNLH